MLAPGAAASASPGRRLSPFVQVFGHRGACALRPEHTLASYALAIADGADYVEPDLVITKDGVLVARHENNIAETTDVKSRPEFAGRMATKTVDGEVTTGWFTEDFTLAELKTLRAVERLPNVRPQNTVYDGEFQVPTFEEYLDFVAAEAALRGRAIGLVPEIKHSTYFASIGLPMEDRFLAVLSAHSYARRAPVEIQSFEIANLRYLRAKLGRPSNVRLMQLVDIGDQRPADVVAAGGQLSFAEMTSAAGLVEMARYADVVAPPTRAMIPLGSDHRLAAPTTLVDDAHRAGLLVHSWTFRPENQFLAADFRDAAGPSARNPKGSVAEIRRYLQIGLDGFFTDDPALGREAVGLAA
ncbi:glycerophosphodiester phosphodiesterase [Caulobacter sp. S45]|uniref:glycerophosphodiester phosphodiesterase n=1 Tax=Caulobacter sp. S45 TaxID=1641861 RepID=UPI001C2D8C19|nr:glycerophosphodiester phosphodiesterase [Caulobacter sp. S45]